MFLATADALLAAWSRSPFLLVVALFGLVLMSLLLFLVLFEPGLDYKIRPPAEALDSAAFLHLLGALSDAEVRCAGRVEVLTNGQAFYEAELAAIRAARRSITLEVFTFERG